MDYDFLVIGGGSAGYSAAREAAGLGLKTCVVEGGAEVGGLCILRGCMPSKTLIESANRMLAMRQAVEFGLYARGIGFHGSAIINRKRRLIGEFADYRREELESGKFDFFRAHAVFVDANTIRLRMMESGEERTIRSRSFLISTGSVHSWPEIPGLNECGCLTSDDVLELANIPASIVVLGGGPVGLELAHYFNALGTKVTVLQRGEHLLKGVDAEAADVVEHAFGRRKMDIFTKTSLVRVENNGGARRVVFMHQGVEKTVEAAQVLNAMGRKPNTSGIGLEGAGVSLSDCMVATNASQQTSQPHIFAAGDCCGPFEIVHIAVEQGALAARNAARVLRGEDGLESMDYRLKLYVVFTEPQVAVVGLTETEAREKGLNVASASYPFNDHGKSLIMNETDGFVKLVVDAESREILGGCVVGPHAADLIHEIVVAMSFRATAGQLACIPHYHPTLSEIWTYPAEKLALAAPNFPLTSSHAPLE